MSIPSTSIARAPAGEPPRFLERVRQAGLERFGRAEAAQAWVDWSRRFILFHNKRHPSEMGAAEIGQFLGHVGQSGGSVEDVLNAREALTLMYENVLHRSVGEVALPAPPRLLDRVRLALRVRHYSPRTEACYVDWAVTEAARRAGIVHRVGRHTLRHSEYPAKHRLEIASLWHVDQEWVVGPGAGHS